MNELSQNLGQAPVWKDIAQALKAAGFENILNLAAKHEADSMAMTTKIWAREEKIFNALEKEEFDTFSDKLTAKDFADIDKTAQKFQDTRKRFAGAKRLDWYKQQLDFKKRLKEPEWKDKMNGFYANQLPAIYASVALAKKGAPEWQDIRAKITDPNLLYLLENKFKNESEAKWTVFWKAEKEKFNETGEEKMSQFLRRLKPNQLDSYQTAKVEFEEKNPELKADDKWFKPSYEKSQAEALKSYNTNHEKVVNTLPDSTLAASMQSAFEAASTFAERSAWLAENKQKVSEYTAFINQNNSLEAALTTRATDYPDLKKQLAQIKGKYNEGKMNYSANFYSPRKYNEALTALNDRVNEREHLTTNTINYIENRTFNQIPKLTDNKKLSYDEFRDALKKLDFYKLDPAIRKNEKVRSAARARTKALHEQWLDHRMLHIEQNKKTQVEKSNRVISRVKLPKKLPDNLTDYQAFTVALKNKGVYDALPKGVLKNEKVRATAHAQNVMMWEQYQALQTKNKASEEVNLNDDPKLNEAKNYIKNVKLDSALQLKLIAKLADKDAKDVNTFTVALRELQVYDGVDSSVWKNPALREQAWQQNMKLQREFLNKSDSSLDMKTNSAEDKEQNENYGLPSHYKINWDSLDSRLNPDQKKRAIERFKEMHNRSDVGLQTVMQEFHQPLGTFILETLAVMPKDKYDKAVNALKDVRVEAGKREQVSDWLKVLCKNAGLSFLEKETSTGFSQLKQNFNTYFGTSLNKAWEVGTDEVEEVTDIPEETSDLKPKVEVTDKETAVDEDEVKTKTSPQDEDEIEVETDVPPELIIEDELPALEPEPLPEVIDEPAFEPVNTTHDEIVPDLAGSDLTVNDGALDITEVEEVVEAEEEITEVIADTISFESEKLMADDTDVEDEAVLEAVIDELEAVETDDEETLETTEDVDNTEIVEDSTDIEDDELIADTGDVEAAIDTEAKIDEEEALESPEAVDDASLEDDAPDVTPEVIPVVRIENNERAAEVHEALMAWQHFTETNLPTGIKSESEDLKKQFSEILKTGLDESTIAQLKASGNWEKLMASPAHQQLLRTHMKQHETLQNEDLHFFTALQQELYFSSSVTVNKFLEQLKSYTQFTKEVAATITTPPSDKEMSKETAQTLFNAFATKFHTINQINSLSLGYKNHQLEVSVNDRQQKQIWHFEAGVLEDV